MDKRLESYVEKMQKTMSNLDAELGTIRAGRANPKVLDRINVDYYGTQTPLRQVANITVPEARIIQIQPWEASLLKEITKVIRLVFPELTEERRKQLVKDAEKKGEAAKVAIRNIRRDGNDSFKKLKKEDVSEDEIKKLQDDLQKQTDKFSKEVVAAVSAKSKEILTI